PCQETGRCLPESMQLCSSSRPSHRCLVLQEELDLEPPLWLIQDVHRNAGQIARSSVGHIESSPHARCTILRFETGTPERGDIPSVYAARHGNGAPPRQLVESAVVDIRHRLEGMLMNQIRCAKSE